MPTKMLLNEHNEQNRYLVAFLLEKYGYAVARALRESSSLASTPIVAVTSYAMLGDREKALAAGCDGYVEKPINPDTFVSQVAGYLRPQGTGDSQ